MSPVMGIERINRAALSGGGVYGGGGEGIDAIAWLLIVHTATRANQDCDCVLCTDRGYAHLPSL